MVNLQLLKTSSSDCFIDVWLLLISLYFMDGLYDYVNIYILLTYKTLFLCIKQGPAENQFSVEQVTLLKYCEINK